MKPLRVRPPAAGLVGELGVPGDKSLGHRALLLGALAEGTTVVRGFPGGADVRATLDAIRRLGASADWTGDVVHVHGRGLALGGQDVVLDCANSGTTMRLGAGLVAGAPGRVTLDGDASLRRRPMERVAAPLRQMGARVTTTDGHAPVVVEGGSLVGVDITTPVASAQVKSCILLAGLRARGVTRVREPLLTRDHTERMLRHLGARIEVLPDGAAVEGGQRLRGAEIPLPGDPSSAAFLVVAALLVDGSELVLRDVGTNPTRTGGLQILARMGAQVILSPSAWAVPADHDNDREPYGQLWRDAYGELCRLYDVTVLGVSNVGPMTGGPWRGRRCIGCSLAMGPGGRVLAQGPYGAAAEALVFVEVRPRPPLARGTDFAAVLQARGYQGP